MSLAGGTPTWEGDAMTPLHCCDDIVDLGVISAETCGVEPLGMPEVETGNYYIFASGTIGADD